MNCCNIALILNEDPNDEIQSHCVLKMKAESYYLPVIIYLILL